MKTYIVDAFTEQPFRGNPAGVCFPAQPLDEGLMLRIAQELGLSETAFVSGAQDALSIRFFSPVMEIPLCGHATLSAAVVAMERAGSNAVCFENVQGLRLEARQTRAGVELVFPRYPVMPARAPDQLLAALGVEDVTNSVFNEETRILMLEIPSAEALARLSPDFDALLRSHDEINGVLVTAPAADGYDFHSRYFWPWSGTQEDPVTGGTHTFLAPYWAERLGRNDVSSYQSSARGGSMRVEVREQDILIIARATIVLEGEMRLGDAA